MAWTMNAVRAVVCILGAAGVAHGNKARRALNKEVLHFEPLNIPNHHIFRRSYGDKLKRHASPFTLPLTVFNKTMHLQLQPAGHLFRPDAVVQHVAEDGTSTTEPLTALGFYSGHVEGAHGFSFAHFHIGEDGTTQGMVMHGDDAFHVEPALDHFEDVQAFDHVVYRTRDTRWAEKAASAPAASIDETTFSSTRAQDESGHRARRAFDAAVKVAADAAEGDKAITIDIAAGGGAFVAAGMTVTSAGGEVAAGTKVFARDGAAVTLTTPLAKALATGAELVFSSDPVVEQKPYVQGKNVCHMALFADKLFTDKYGGKNSAIVRMLQRFSYANAIFEQTKFAPSTELLWTPGVCNTVSQKTCKQYSWGCECPQSGTTVQYNNDTHLTLQIAKILVEEGTILNPMATPKDYLNTFSLKEGDRDWSRYCLAHAFTYTDYEGTLGLAWTAKKKSENYNGGICQAQYRDQKTATLKSLNTGFSSSENFGSQQPEDQSALVLTHEIGHNVGGPHDEAAKYKAQVATAKGVYIMYPYAQSGNKEHHKLFSPDTIATVSAVLTDKGGCMQPAADAGETCGNFVTDGEDECDCGGNEDICTALQPKGKCCTSKCKFRGATDTTAAATCSPLDKNAGICCTDECTTASPPPQCKDQDVCQAAAMCTVAGTCPAVADNRPDDSICAVGVSKCEDNKCTSMCKAGACTASICDLWGMQRCSEVGPEACSIKCSATPTDKASCKSPKDLGATQRPAFSGTGNATTAFTIDKQKGGGSCEFELGDATSGLCDKVGLCVPADQEEDSLAELKRIAEAYKRQFSDWLAEDQGGLSNQSWLILGGVIILLLCVGCCYITNRGDPVKELHG